MTEAVQEGSVTEDFVIDMAAAARSGVSLTPVLKRHQIHPRTWADLRAIAIGRMVRYRNGSQVSDDMREWCRFVHGQVLEAKIERRGAVGRISHVAGLLGRALPGEPVCK